MFGKRKEIAEKAFSRVSERRNNVVRISVDLDGRSKGGFQAAP